MSKTINIEFDEAEQVYFVFNLAVITGRVGHISVNAMTDPADVNYTIQTSFADYPGNSFMGEYNEIFKTFKEARSSILKKLRDTYEERVAKVKSQEEIE